MNVRERILSKEEEILQQIMNISKISSKTGNERDRTNYIQNLLYGYGIGNPMIDCAGNVFSKLEGKSEDSIIICTHMDDYEPFANIKLTSDKIIGKNVTNAMAIYSAVFLSSLLKSEIHNNTIYFLGTVDSFDTMKGIKFFIDNFKHSIKGLVEIEGLSLGRISKSTDAILRIRVDFRSELVNNASSNTFFAINNFSNKIRDEIFKDKVNVNIGEVSCGNSYKDIPYSGYMKIEIQSEKMSENEDIYDILKGIARGITEENRVNISFTEEFKRDTTQNTVSVIEPFFIKAADELQIKIIKESSNSEIFYPSSKKIDTISVGVAVGGKAGQIDEYIEIKSIYRGIEYLLKAILELDKDL